ncbi:hypothetical protein BGZ73_002294 [Actinomortierella ambigua]|nr:hypothetical protein BGZ73_002294 [Actinomortierella ambigua]
MNSDIPDIPPPLPKRAPTSASPTHLDAPAATTAALPPSYSERNSMAGDNIQPPPAPPRANTPSSGARDNTLQHPSDARDTKPLLPPRPPEQPPPVVTLATVQTETIQNNPVSLQPASQQPPSRTSSPPDHPHATARLASVANNANNANNGSRHPVPPSPTATTDTASNNGAQGRGKAKNEEITFQFDRHVQEIRRRRTVAKGPPKPDPEDFTTVEAESGKRIFNVPHYIRAIYFGLWSSGLWLAGFMTCFVLKILNNRYMILGNLHQLLSIPQSLNERMAEQQRQHRNTKMRSQLDELIASRDLTDWLMTVMKIWGPYLQSLAEENIGYIERFKNLMRWERPHQTWRVIGLLVFYIIVSAFSSFLVLPAIDTELAVERLTKRQEDQMQRQQQSLDEAASEPSDTASTSSGSAEKDLRGMSPASRIKYEYQNRSSSNNHASSSSPSIHSTASDAQSLAGPHDKNEYHCMLRGKPGKLVIHEDNIQFRSAKLLGHDVEVVLPWDMIDTIKKTKTMSIGIWSTPGIEVIDINGRHTTFQNVVHRDDAFRKLVLTSGKKWTNVQ